MHVPNIIFYINLRILANYGMTELVYNKCQNQDHSCFRRSKSARRISDGNEQKRGEAEALQFAQICTRGNS